MPRLAHAWVLLLLLPAGLLLNAAVLWRQLNQARTVSLRDTAARVAAHLETLPAGELANAGQILAEETTSLANLQIFETPANGPDFLPGLLSGQELFRFEELPSGVFRAWVPFHNEGRTLVAAIDLDSSSTEHLAAGALRSVAISALSAAALLALTGFFVWTQRQEARRREEAARLARLAEIGRLGAVLAHEIRNPLGAVKGFLQLSREKSSGDNKFYLDAALEQTSRLERLVQELLQFARTPSPQCRPTSWREVTARLRSLAPEATYLDGDAQWLTDPDMLEQILLNLIRNAQDAVSDQHAPEIRVEARQGSIEVCDNGPGIPAEIRSRLFEPFATTKAQGTGLGLAISRNLAEALGARLALEDRSPSGTRARLIWRTS
ncbi:MAG: HAMP domain-containing histidine kinase [Bryobacteraceae bacterium]|nr:HAMP domain-containing histidine kinase [Bryobacteraceae bacterium]